METTDALRSMARHVAHQLIAQELHALGNGNVAITVHAVPEVSAQPRLALPPAQRRGRKPGKRKSKAWSAEQRAKFAATMAARRRGPGRPPKDGQTSARAARTNRSAAAEGATSRERPARCTRCDHTDEEHEPNKGRCLSFRCTCRELVF